MADDQNAATSGDEPRLDRLIDITARIITSHAGSTAIASDDLPGLIGRVFTALSSLKLDGAALNGSAHAAKVEAEGVTDVPSTPAVAISESVTPDALICLEDGKPVKLLHRYLRTRHGITPAEYKKKWGLPSDYPMVAPAYSDSRREHASRVGFKKAEPAAEPPVIPVAEAVAPKKSRRRAKSQPPSVAPVAVPVKPRRRRAAPKNLETPNTGALPKPVRARRKKSEAMAGEVKAKKTEADVPAARPAKRPRRKLGIVSKG